MKTLVTVLFVLISNYSIASFADNRTYEMSQGSVNLDKFAQAITHNLMEHCRLYRDDTCKMERVRIESMRGSYDPLTNALALGEYHVHVVNLKVNDHQIQCDATFNSDENNIRIDDCVSSSMSVDLFQVSILFIKYSDIGLKGVKANY